MQGKFSEKTATRVMASIMRAMQHAHKNSIYHGYLRPGNVLVARGSDYQDLRIINFPLGMCFENNERLNEKFKFPYFMAPELFKDKLPTASCDCWSIGAMIFFLLTGNLPFPGDTDNEIKARVQSGQIAECPMFDKCSDDAKDLITKLLTVDPSKRLTIDQTLKHPWIQNGENIEEKENTVEDNEAFEGMKDYNI